MEMESLFQDKVYQCRLISQYEQAYLCHEPFGFFFKKNQFSFVISFFFLKKYENEKNTNESSQK